MGVVLLAGAGGGGNGGSEGPTWLSSGLERKSRHRTGNNEAESLNETADDGVLWSEHDTAKGVVPRHD